MTIGAVAEKYSVSIGALSLWRKQRATGETASASKMKRADTASKMKRSAENEPRSGKNAKEPGRGKKPPPDADGRARALVDLADAPAMARQLRRAAWGMSGYLARVGAAHEAYVRAEALRAELRAAGKTQKEIDETCPLPAYPDMRQMDAGARALRTTLEIAPGLASFDADTGGTAGSNGPTAEELAAMDRTMLAEPGGLSVIPGGRATESAG